MKTVQGQLMLRTWEGQESRTCRRGAGKGCLMGGSDHYTESKRRRGSGRCRSTGGCAWRPVWLQQRAQGAGERAEAGMVGLPGIIPCWPRQQTGVAVRDRLLTEESHDPPLKQRHVVMPLSLYLSGRVAQPANADPSQEISRLVYPK